MPIFFSNEKKNTEEKLFSFKNICLTVIFAYDAPLPMPLFVIICIFSKFSSDKVPRGVCTQHRLFLLAFKCIKFYFVKECKGHYCLSKL